MSTSARLDRLMPTLSAKERALLVLRAYKAGQREDPAVQRTMPRGQGAEFNRYIHLMNAVNCELAFAVMIIQEQVRQTDLRYGWLMTLQLWGMEAESLAVRAMAPTTDCHLRRDIRRLLKHSPVPVELLGDLAEDDDAGRPEEEGFGRSIVRGLLAAITDGLERQWRELRSIEIGVAEVAEEFGEDPLQPGTRELLDGCLSSCTELRASVAKHTDIELAEPDEEILAQVRLLIEQAAEPAKTR